MLSLAEAATRAEIVAGYGLIKRKGYRLAHIAAVKCALVRDRSLELLSVASCFLRDPAIPSWFPSFQPNLSMAPLLSVQRRAGYFNLDGKEDNDEPAIDEIIFPHYRYD
jgi:hypothetical protein